MTSVFNFTIVAISFDIYQNLNRMSFFKVTSVVSRCVVNVLQGISEHGFEQF